MRCARCQWRHDPEGEQPAAEQLGEHALATGHRLCVVCRHSLAEHDPDLACERCLTRTREQLAAVLVMFAELPSHLGQLRSQVYDRDRHGGTDGRPLPGGDVLTLLGRGSAGNVSRFGDDYEPPPDRPERWWVLGAVGPLTRADYQQAERARWGKEHLADNVPTDVPSVAWTLSSWEEIWRDEFEDDLPGPDRSTRAVVRDAVAYLDAHARRAAKEFMAFDDFAEDVQKLHGQLERATGRVRKQGTANAQCFDCGGDLVRELHEVTKERWWLLDRVGPLPYLIHRAGPVEAATVVDGEELPVYTCTQCGEVYDHKRYDIALADEARKASRLDVAGETYATPAVVARHVGRAEQTVRNWAATGLVRRTLRNGVVFLNLGDAATQSDTRKRRQRLPA